MDAFLVEACTRTGDAGLFCPVSGEESCSNCTGSANETYRDSSLPPLRAHLFAVDAISA